MQYRRLGHTDLHISEIGFGCGNTAGLMIWGDPHDRLRDAERAMELGINYFDTAPLYGQGRSEKVLGHALKGVTEPERKRKIIGKTFIEVFDETVTSIGAVEFLAQGTLYPDVIESVPIGGNPAALIKSHHNVGGLPESLNLKLLEPLSELFKDEVRRMGVELGLPTELVNRHPFPGPGLGVRILGEVKKEYADILREVDGIFLDELRDHGLYDEVSQAFAVFLPVKSVGVVGDNRAYE